MIPRELNNAYTAWCAGASLRQRRKRFKDYTYGRQWGDIIDLANGRRIKEMDFAIESGFRPLTNNLIRQMVKTVVGLYRRDYAAPFPEALAHTAARNSLAELDARTLEEFLISGCAIQRIVSERRTGGNGVWIDNVSPENFFVNRFSDPRGCDIELVGMLHNMSCDEVAARFGGNDPDRRQRLKQICLRAADNSIVDTDSAGFFAAPGGRCRLIEVWTLRPLQAIKCYDPRTASIFFVPATQARKISRTNSRRPKEQAIVFKTIDTARWHCTWFAPSGETVAAYLSPFAHGSHPFAIKFYPLTDGEVHPFVEDVIDQQKYVNRVITMIDNIMQTSAKGVLLFPEDRKPDGFTWNDIADIWSDCRGIIPYKSSTRTNAMPTQITTSGATADAHRLLSTQLELMEQISGVSGGLMGRNMPGNASASLYQALAHHSTTALSDLLGTFADFIDKRNNIIATP